MEAGWEWPALSSRSHLKIKVRNRWSPIQIFHGFASKLYILYKSVNIVHWVSAYRRCDKPDDVQFMKSSENYVTSFDAGLRYQLIKCVWKLRFLSDSHICQGTWTNQPAWWALLFYVHWQSQPISEAVLRLIRYQIRFDTVMSNYIYWFYSLITYTA